MLFPLFKKGEDAFCRSSESQQEAAALSGFRNDGQAPFMHVHDLPGNT